MRFILSVIIWLAFSYLKFLELKWSLDSIKFRFLWLRQLPEVNLDFIWVIIKKLLILPQLVFDYILLFLSNFTDWKIFDINIYLEIFIFYFILSYLILKISSFFYWKDALLLKIIIITAILAWVYFI